MQGPFVKAAAEFGYQGFFGDPMYGGNKDMAAWKMIGYPGVRADFIDFADKNARYPFGPVDMHGRNP
jgi:gluconate 2-dehydrogenase gamma chain